MDDESSFPRWVAYTLCESAYIDSACTEWMDNLCMLTENQEWTQLCVPILQVAAEFS